jgi:dephospho-CoA kinase
MLGRVRVSKIAGGIVLVGLTGGIGAGKSAVASRLASHGAVVVDGDKVAREVVAPGTEGLAEVVAEFGRGVLSADGSLDRPALGRIVFGDEGARRRLEAITHPRIRARTVELIAAAPAGSVVVNDVPLLVEGGMAGAFELVVIVFAPLPVRLRRLMDTRGMSREEAEARIAAQATDEQRRAVADVAIENDGTLDDLNERVDEVWRGITSGSLRR